MGRKRGKKILRHVTALFFDFITVLANLISERRHNITIYEWERKSRHGNGHIYYELRPRAFNTALEHGWRDLTALSRGRIPSVPNFDPKERRKKACDFAEICILKVEWNNYNILV